MNCRRCYISIQGRALSAIWAHKRILDLWDARKMLHNNETFLSWISEQMNIYMINSFRQFQQSLQGGQPQWQILHLPDKENSRNIQINGINVLFITQISQSLCLNLSSFNTSYNASENPLSDFYLYYAALEMSLGINKFKLFVESTIYLRGYLYLYWVCTWWVWNLRGIPYPSLSLCKQRFVFLRLFKQVRANVSIMTVLKDWWDIGIL